MNDFMRQHGARLADSGFSVIPAMPKDKFPAQLKSGEWYPYKDWSRHCDRPTRSFEVDIWSRWDECGIGIACGRVAAIDIDVLDAEYALAIERLAFDKFGETPAVRIGLMPKRLLVYRAKEPFKKIKAGPVEILCHGQQFIAYGTHPDTKKPYLWPNESLVDIDIDDLPEIDEESARDFVIQAQKILPVELRGSKLGPDMSRERSDISDLEGTQEGIEAALRYIDNNDLHYDDWIKIGLAIKGALGDDGDHLFDEWSSRSPKYDSKTTEKAWATFKPIKIGAGTIYGFALNAGWSPDARITLNGAEARASNGVNGSSAAELLLAGMNGPKTNGHAIEIPAVKVIENTPDPTPCKINGSRVNGHVKACPSDGPPLEGMSGAVKEMVDWIVSTSFRPQPFLALGATLTALGTAMGRRYATPTDLRSNLYIVGIANSGSGKEHARRCIRDLFVSAGLLDYLGGERIASGPAITSALIRHPAILFQLDEFGQMLKSVLSEARPQKHIVEIWQNLTQLSTSASTVFGGTEYAVHPDNDDKKKKKTGPDIIVNPHVCINATSTPGQFWEALTDGAILDGGFARYLVFISPEQYPEAEMNATCQPPQSLVDAVKVMSVGEETSGKLIGMMHHNVNSDPRLVPYGPGVEEHVGSMVKRQTQRLRQDENSSMNSVVARSVENSLKIALICAVADDPKTPLIEMRHIKWASDLVDYCIKTAVEDASEKMRENQHKMNQDEILDAVRSSGDKGMPKSVLTERTRYKMAPRARKEALDDLIEACAIMVEEKRQEGPGRPSQVYHALI